MTHRLRMRTAATWCLAATVAAAAGCDRRPNATTQDGASPANETPRLVVDKPQRKTLTLVTSQPGRIEAFEETPLFAKVSGYVAEVLVDIGDPVKKDQPLVRLSVPEMQDDLQQQEALRVQAVAEVAQAKSAVVGAQAAVRSAAAKVVQAEAGTARVEAELQRWTAEHARLKQLAAARSVTEKLVDETLSQVRAAEAAKRETAAGVQAAEAAREEARVNVQKAESDTVAAEARRGVAEANLARTKTLLGYTILKAPFDGVVTQRSVDTGHYVHPPGGPTAQPLLVVCRTDVVRIFIDVPELEAERIQAGERGDKADVRVQALGNKSFAAKVTRTAWSLDPTNRSLRTEIDVPNPDGLLRPGMYAVGAIVLEERPDVSAIPAAAVVRDGADTFVWIVHGGKAERRKIELGLRVGAEVEVRAGLAPDDAVVLAPSANLQPGQPATAVAPEKK